MCVHLKQFVFKLNYSRDEKRTFFALKDSGGEADDYTIHWLIRTDGEVNKLHIQVIAGFLLGRTEEKGGH